MTMRSDWLQDEIDRIGFAIQDSVLSGLEVSKVLTALNSFQRELTVERRGGMRNVLVRIPAIAALVNHPGVVESVHAVLGPKAFAVRGLLFDKQPKSNWKVDWHQDLTIAVASRVEVPQYGPWSVKAGIVHVQPPPEILQQMLTIRLNLDPCGEKNGPLRVLPTSHRYGVIPPSDIAGYAQVIQPAVCVASAGGMVLMRPLLLHGSAPAQYPSHRRILHLEFAAVELEAPIVWHERYSCGSRGLEREAAF